MPGIVSPSISWGRTDVWTGVSLDYLCRDRSQTTSLEALSSSILGIEVDHYLRKLIQQSRSPLYTPWGGVAQSFFRIISHDLSILKQLNIKPFFVFTGLQIVSQHEADPNLRLAARTLALSSLERKRNEETIQAFTALTSTIELVAALKRYLQAEQVDFLVAPYFAAAQLTYMLKSGSVDSIYAAPDVFVHGAERSITDISFEQNLRVTFCDKSAILGLLQGINEDQFLDAYLFAGNDFCPIVPILEPNPPSEFSAFRMRAAADVVRQNGTGYLALHGNPVLEKRPNYLEQWLKAKALFKFHPYLNLAGDVVLSKEDKAPSDVARVIGARLPREVYYYISRGLIEPQLIDTLLSGVWRESPPLDGGDSREYRRLLEELDDIRVKCMDLLHGSKQLHHYYEKKVVVTKKWYRGNTSEAIEKLDSPVYNDLRTWQVTGSSEGTGKAHPDRDLRSLLKLWQEDSSDGKGKKLKEPQEASVYAVQANVLYRVLQLRGYIGAKQELTSWGRALVAALDEVDDALLIPTLCAIEMLKLRAISPEDHARDVRKMASQAESAESNVKTLCSIAALLPLKQNDAPWQGPLDREALASFSLAQTTYRYLAGLYEMCQLAMLLRGDVRRSEDFIKDLSSAVNPFVIHHDAGLAIYSRRYFALHGDNSTSTGTIYEQLKAAFPTSKNGAADMGNFFKLWDGLYAAINAVSMEDKSQLPEKGQFDLIQEWLSTRR
ncbi:XPG I-region protein [Taphrina deformans PYCC 5710]|uniref:XPG I-region protein n=1 Tax=Taphrina deformans (strain PYCC 5710 / ATCC 11124 / CBS 356.35 / IMI 108563 / JCM 9778 / NBRC 8474) TaxID=1097556 RepID=R4X716_TAPDE|nr:XPG I-region protein [Taphrina deformans PYCC 5710]|eukprot:CCG81031.1 XPG I-region protein [Taphrina deformans PYCC 5710]